MNWLMTPFINGLVGTYGLTGSLGMAVILVTVVVKLLTLPLVLPSLKSADKMRELQPKLKKLTEKFGKDKEGLAKAQMQLYKEEGVNPLSGCLPQLLTIGILIIFFSAFSLVSNVAAGKMGVEEINRYLVPGLRLAADFKFEVMFLGSNLMTTPAAIAAKEGLVKMWLPIILLLGSGGLQYWSAKMMMPDKSPKVDDTAYVKETPGAGDDMMAAMRTQSLYVMPAMTVFIGWNFSIGMLLYWFMNSVLMVGQQMVVSRKKAK